jgi:phenylalanine-4-hydroxylase
MFHDVFGHVPLLSVPSFGNFVSGLSKIAIKHLDNSIAMEMLGRIYWFTLEFGLIHEKDSLKIYGAGICSSAGEIKNALSGNVVHKKFSVKEIMITPFQNDRIQNLYFVIDEFDELFDSLSEIEREIGKNK